MSMVVNATFSTGLVLPHGARRPVRGLTVSGPGSQGSASGFAPLRPDKPLHPGLSAAVPPGRRSNNVSNRRGARMSAGTIRNDAGAAPSPCGRRSKPFAKCQEPIGKCQKAIEKSHKAFRKRFKSGRTVQNWTGYLTWQLTQMPNMACVTNPDCHPSAASSTPLRTAKARLPAPAYQARREIPTYVGTVAPDCRLPLAALRGTTTA